MGTRCRNLKNQTKDLRGRSKNTRAEILVGIQLDCDWDYLLQLGI